MCGIVGYIGNKNAVDILINGLKKLEYRGYDSVGIMLYGQKTQVLKCAGKVADLQEIIATSELEKAHLGIGHTRWATHGVPNTTNSHPHSSNSGKLHIVHNGIIENYQSIKKVLTQKGYYFHSDTDTEVFVNLIEEIKLSNQLDLSSAVRIALNQVIGAYAIVVYDTDEPDDLVVAKLGSPLTIGLGEGSYFVGSDASPFIEHTKRCLILNDFEMATLSLNNGMIVKHIKDNVVLPQDIVQLQYNIEQIEKGGYKHFMLKEIYEQPTRVEDTFRGRLISTQDKIKISSIERYHDKFASADRLIFVSCGTSWHASLLGEYYFEELVRIPVEVEYASEFRYRNPVIKVHDIVIPVSQSGETADTLAAIKMVKNEGVFLYGVCNVVGSSIARETDSGVYIHAGPEIGVASTKAFTCQASLLLLLALRIGYGMNKVSKIRFQQLLSDIDKIPMYITQVLKLDDTIRNIAYKYADANNFLFLARGCNFPIALEGALKLKEISYIHAEGYPAAEMKHGPIALIDENMPVVVIATKKGNYHKILNNIMEIKARGGQIIAVVTKGDDEIVHLANDIIEIPDCDELVTPIIANIPLQLLAYHIADIKGCDVDQPRNLAKSVTVE